MNANHHYHNPLNHNVKSPLSQPHTHKDGFRPNLCKHTRENITCLPPMYLRTSEQSMNSNLGQVGTAILLMQWLPIWIGRIVLECQRVWLLVVYVLTMSHNSSNETTNRKFMTSLECLLSWYTYGGFCRRHLIKFALYFEWS